MREEPEYYDPEETERRARAIVRAAAKTLPIGSVWRWISAKTN